jgi:hypothetical protein
LRQCADAAVPYPPRRSRRPRHGRCRDPARHGRLERRADEVTGALSEDVAPDITFADLTGDGRSDAIVLVDSAGVAGAVALYVFSTDGEAAESDLRVVYRSQRLYRASAEVADGALRLDTPRFAEGDDVCCPAKIVRRTYAWSPGNKTLRQRSSQELPGPTG